MFGLIFSQLSLWVLLALGLMGIWVWFFLAKRDDFQVPGIASGVLVLGLILTYSLGMSYGTEVQDFCVLNGHVISAEYAEEWTEEYYTTETTKDSKGNVTSSRRVRHTTHHSPSWSVRTTVGSWGISSSMYAGYRNRFSHQVQTGSRHMGQCSWGDGRTYETRWGGGDAQMVPVSNTETVPNWVKASKFTILKQKSNGASVLPYPTLIDTAHGPKQPRVLVEGVPVPPPWKEAMEWNLDVLADKVGRAKQCNPLIYITNKPISQVENIKAQWMGAKKNDAVVVIGVQEWPKVDYIQVISWSKNQMFPVQVKNLFMDLTLEDGNKVAQTLQGAIFRHYERRPMAEFEYLKKEIETPGWIYVVGVILAVGTILGAGLVKENRYYRRW